MVLAILAFCLSCMHRQTAEGTLIKQRDNQILSITGQRQISGIYPHLTTYSHGRVDGIYGKGNECGIGALAVWNEKREFFR